MRSLLGVAISIPGVYSGGFGGPTKKIPNPPKFSGPYKINSKPLLKNF